MVCAGGGWFWGCVWGVCWAGFRAISGGVMTDTFPGFVLLSGGEKHELCFVVKVSGSSLSRGVVIIGGSGSPGLIFKTTQQRLALVPGLHDHDYGADSPGR